MAVPLVPAAADALVSAWPPFGIRVTVGDVALRLVREAELVTLAHALPDDAELDPSSQMLDGLSADENRRRLVLQTYWSTLGGWSPGTWTLFFGVHRNGQLIGLQGLEGRSFPELRTVDSFSWLVDGARGAGVGTAARRAVLSLAFGSLGAALAVSSAREDNAASLAVSAKLGYVDNGTSRDLSPTGPCTLRHMLLRRETWEASRQAAGVTVEGVSGCAAWFGVTVTT